MNTSPKTIQIFLPKGDSHGIRIAEITTRIIQAIDIPRNQITDFFAMPERKQVAVYILLGESEENSIPQVYIGETEDLKKRLSEHNIKKNFWQRAIILISKTNSLTKTHSLYLERFFIQEAKKAARYRVDVNKTNGSTTHTPAHLEADCIEIFETAKILVSTLGFPIFDPLIKNKTKKQDIFYCKRASENMLGEYTDEGFVILKNSTGKAEINKPFINHSFNKLRDNLLNQGKIAIVNNKLVFKENILFSTPSGAAAVACGASANGWTEWKTKDGLTLHEVKRENVIKPTLDD